MNTHAAHRRRVLRARSATVEVDRGLFSRAGAERPQHHNETRLVVRVFQVDVRERCNEVVTVDDIGHDAFELLFSGGEGFALEEIVRRP